MENFKIGDTVRILDDAVRKDSLGGIPVTDLYSVKSAIGNIGEIGKFSEASPNILVKYLPSACCLNYDPERSWWYSPDKIELVYSKENFGKVIDLSGVYVVQGVSFTDCYIINNENTKAYNCTFNTCEFEYAFLKVDLCICNASTMDQEPPIYQGFEPLRASDSYDTSVTDATMEEIVPICEDLNDLTYEDTTVNLINVKTMTNCKFIECKIINNSDAAPVDCVFDNCDIETEEFGYAEREHFYMYNTVQGSEETYPTQTMEFASKYQGQIVSLYDCATLMFVTSRDKVMVEPDFVVEEVGNNKILKKAFKWLGKSVFWGGKYGVISRYHTDVEDGIDKPEVFIQFLDGTYEFVILNKSNKKLLRQQMLLSNTWVNTQSLLD